MSDPAEIAREWITHYVNEEHDALEDAIETHVVMSRTPDLCAIIDILVTAIGDSYESPEDWSAHVISALLEDDAEPVDADSDEDDD